MTLLPTFHPPNQGTRLLPGWSWSGYIIVPWEAHTHHMAKSDVKSYEFFWLTVCLSGYCTQQFCYDSSLPNVISHPYNTQSQFVDHLPLLVATAIYFWGVYSSTLHLWVPNSESVRRPRFLLPNSIFNAFTRQRWLYYIQSSLHSPGQWNSLSRTIDL